ncbi:hypothetical protein SO802_008370 [Lithocarpus litseifolius]|uniref:DNA topoisomerase (ATP-hydrolyzing) n=1 Tax=Lithocarpus litseifolius TaxID=425828 RepID=A0AAW2DAZ7_9ROSI
MVSSLASTIIGMAQDYVGSNNINLLQPNGQFGTCNYGGKDHASARKRADLFVELQTKGLTPFAKNAKAVEPEVTGANDDTEETETIEKVQELCADRDKLNKEVDDLRKETTKSFWRKDVDGLEGQLNFYVIPELEKSNAQSEELRKKMRGKARGEAAMKSTRQAPKNHGRTIIRRQILKNLLHKLSRHLWLQWKTVGVKQFYVYNMSEKADLVLNDDDDDDNDDDDNVLKLKERLAAYNLDSYLHQSAAMETEVPKVPGKKKEHSKRAAAAKKKKPLATVSEISDDDDDDDINEIDDEDEDGEIEVVAAPEARKKGGRKPAANAKAVKAPAAAKKRGAANKRYLELWEGRKYCSLVAWSRLPLMVE